MSIGSGLALFIIIWWLVFFMVLPFGVRREQKVEPGHDPGAPQKPMLWIKIAATTLITAVLFTLWWWIQASGLIAVNW